jgi:tetratricopeptide (TPR) repeat protein
MRAGAASRRLAVWVWPLGLCVVPAATLRAGPTSPATPSPPPTVAECTRAFDRGDYARALELSRLRLAARPADTGAQIVLARAEAAQGRFEAAYQGFRKVLARDPRNTDALYYVTILGGVLAQAEYDRLLAMAPDSARAHQLLGDLYRAQERPTDAEAEYEKGLKADPGALDLLVALGDLSRHQARYEEAVSYYERALHVSPHHFDALYGLGADRSYKREYAPAIAAFREALAVDGSSAAAHLALGHALLQSGQAAAAVPELEKAAARETRGAQAHYLLGRAYTILGRTQEAAAVFEKVKVLSQDQTLEEQGARPADPPAPDRAPAPRPSPEGR